MSRRAAYIVIVLAMGGFGIGLWQLFNLRFSAGDVYPAYSSLRADPLGTMAIYEALGRMQGVEVERDYRADGRLPESPAGTVYLHLAADPREWRYLPETLVSDIEAFALRGGRLVVLFAPRPEAPPGWDKPKKPRPAGSPPERVGRGVLTAPSAEEPGDGVVLRSDHGGVGSRASYLARMTEFGTHGATAPSAEEPGDGVLLRSSHGGVGTRALYLARMTEFGTYGVTAPSAEEPGDSVLLRSNHGGVGTRAPYLMRDIAYGPTAPSAEEPGDSVLLRSSQGGVRTRAPYLADSTAASEEAEREPVADAKELVSLEKRWGLELAFLNLIRNEPVEVVCRAGADLPERLEWHTGLILARADEPWQTLYSRGKYPVLVERRWGAGSVVIGTDSYLVSNEALRRDRQPELLSWMVGRARRIVFDEAHLGITEPPGVATLMRRYRLWWVAAALGVVAMLFVWKSSASLLPIRAPDTGEEILTGRAAVLGFINLLRRNIAPRDLAETCVREWLKTAGRLSRQREEKVQEAMGLLRARRANRSARPDPIGDYEEVRRILELTKTRK